MDVVPFNSRIDRSNFRCGKPDLDDWIARYAGQSERRNTTRTFLALDGGELVGYYALRVYELDLDETAAAFGVGVRRYPVPAILLARLAIAEEVQGLRFGARLLADALQRIVAASESVGFEVVVVEAVDTQAAAFYQRFGFTRFEDDPLHLFVPVHSLRLTFSRT